MDSEFYYKYADDETWCVIRYTGQDAHVLIPDTHGGRDITILNDDLFKGHENLESVHIPARLRTLGGFLFDGCSRLHQVLLPDTLTDMWQYAFVRSGITEIEIPGSVKHIIPFVFKDCTQLQTVRCGKGVQKIFANAFAGCTSLEKVYVHADTEIAEGAFAGCGQVTVIRR